MNKGVKTVYGALALWGALVAWTAPADAGTEVGISFGWYGPGVIPFGDPCAYYDYYDIAPPWGLPPDYCDYPVYFGSVFWDGLWYRGPIYYRWYGGERLYWLNGGWHRDSWRGGRPPQVRWQDRGGLGNGVRFRDIERGFIDRRREGPAAVREMTDRPRAAVRGPTGGKNRNDGGSKDVREERGNGRNDKSRSGNFDGGSFGPDDFGTGGGRMPSGGPKGGRGR